MAVPKTTKQIDIKVRSLKKQITALEKKRKKLAAKKVTKKKVTKKKAVRRKKRR